MLIQVQDELPAVNFLREEKRLCDDHFTRDRSVKFAP